MKRYSTSGKDKLKPQCVIFTCSLVGKRLKTLVFLTIGKDVAQWEFSYITACALVQSFWRTVQHFLVKLKIHIPETQHFSPRYMHILANVL